MPRDLPEQIAEIMRSFARDVEAKLEAWTQVHDAVAFREMELDAAALCRRVADQLTAGVLEHVAGDPELQARASVAARRHRRYRHGGTREVTVTLLGGSRVQVQMEYLKRDLRGQRGRRRQSGRRGAGGTGLYPMLAVLGIWFGVTPALCAEVCAQVTDSDSVRAGQAALRRRGLALGHKQTQRVVNKFSTRAVEQREGWLEQMRTAPPADGPLSGRRVVVAMDGGRLRERVPARHGRRRKETGHRRYDAPWRVPKLFTIYVLGKDGKVEQRFRPVYDGTLGNCDQMCQMLLGYLWALGVPQATQLIFLGDGARWIWERTGDLAAKLGLPRERVVEVIDWCHAVGVLHEIADARVSFSPEQRERWVRRARKWLYAGQFDELLRAIDALAVGRRAKDVSEHRDYFARNRARMQYESFVAAHVPIGSGTVESAIRRVINMRMKSNGMFWLEAHAQGMLLLRSYLKAGHFDDLVDWSLSQAASWWDFPGRPALPLSFPEAVA